jgi:membrane associated rhomboid family serine protease
LGRWQYLFFYLACGILAMASQMAVAPFSRIPNVGASGAIAGVMGAYLVKFPHARIVTLFWFGLIFTLDVPAVLILAYWFILQLFSGVGSVAEASVRGGVAWFAHIGGFIAGIVLILIMRTRQPHLRRADLNW